MKINRLAPLLSGIIAATVAVMIVFVLPPSEYHEAYGLESPVEDDFVVVAPEPLAYEAEDEPAPEDAVFALPTTMTVYVNEAPFLMPAYNIEGQYYFYFRDIAYVLADTHARFSLWLHGPYSPMQFRGHDGELRYFSPFNPRIHRGEHYDVLGIELHPLPQEPKFTMPITMWMDDQSLLSRGPFGMGVDMDAFDVDNRLYADLRSVGHAIGFEALWDAQSNVFRINTFEPTISEYGRQVAEEFLSQFPTLHYEMRWLHDASSWAFFDPATDQEVEVEMNELFLQNYIYVQRYDLFDLNGNGIPEIVIHWDSLDLSRWGAGQYLYVYNQGSFERVADIGLHIFNRSSQGDVFLYSGDLGSYSGLSGRTYSITMDDNGLHMELLFGEYWHRDEETEEGYVRTAGTLTYLDEEYLHQNWQQYFPNAIMGHVPGRPDELLFPMRPFTLETARVIPFPHGIMEIDHIYMYDPESDSEHRAISVGDEFFGLTLTEIQSSVVEYVNGELYRTLEARASFSGEIIVDGLVFFSRLEDGTFSMWGDSPDNYIIALGAGAVPWFAKEYGWWLGGWGCTRIPLHITSPEILTNLDLLRKQWEIAEEEIGHGPLSALDMFMSLRIRNLNLAFNANYPFGEGWGHNPVVAEIVGVFDMGHR